MPTRKLNPHRFLRRLHADQYLLLMLLAFAGSISFTRLGLYLTGYPQLAGGNLHIAHVLWGGLLLFAAALLMLIFANRIVRIWSAILCGIGVGLFIDEVGKFITSSNDYFYPAAAPIIYVFFLLSVLVFLYARKRHRPSPTTELYAILQEIEEIIDGSFTEDEREDMIDRVEHLRNRIHGKELIALCDSLLVFLNTKEFILPEQTSSFWSKLFDRFFYLEKKFLTHRNARLLLALGFLVLAAWLMIIPAHALFFPLDEAQRQLLIVDLFGSRVAQSGSALLGFQGLIILQALTSLLSFFSALLILIRKEKFALRLGFITLIFTLTLVNLLTFYFDQFSTIFSALFQALLLIALLRYRHRFSNLPIRAR
jgi:hypothetical protein